MRTAKVISSILAGVLLAVPATAQEAPASAEACVACHGEGGNKPIADNPKLAGQLRKYLLFTMRAYKDGSRKDAVMNAQMAPLSDKDLQDLAAYFAKQPGDLQN